MTLRAPFPAFGGKSRVASQIWDRLGDVRVFIDPFCFSCSLFLARPMGWQGTIETANDLNAFVANFWRSVAWAPEETARWADWPVSEADLHARHQWLLEQFAILDEQVMGDPHYYNPKVAGWWAWGLSQWFGDDWCVRPARQRPAISNRGGNGVQSSTRDLREWFLALKDRLRRVQVCCGDWSRVVTPACLFPSRASGGGPSPGITGVVLDPPYARNLVQVRYRHHRPGLSAEVREWAIANGDHPQLRIALCGLVGEHQMPDTWEEVAWRRGAGLGLSQGGEDRCSDERIWFSPHCLTSRQKSLF